MPSREWRGVHFDFAQCERTWGVLARSHSLPSVQPERSRRPRECLRGDGGARTSTSLNANGRGGASTLSHILPSVPPERSRRPWGSPRGDGGACTSTAFSANGGGERRRYPSSFPPFRLSAVEGHGDPLAEMAGRALRLRSVRTGWGECRRYPTSFPPFSLSVVEGHGNPFAEMEVRALPRRSVRTEWGRAIERPRSPAKAGAQLRSDRNGSRRRVGGSNRRVANASHEAVRAPATMGRLGPGLRGEQEAWTRKRAAGPSSDRPSRTANAALTRPRSSAPPGRPSK